MIPPLCFVTDAEAPDAIADQAVAAARAGAGWVQLRHKTLPDAAFADLARQLQAVLAPLGAKLIINDRVDAAVAVAADGLHIGQGDGDPAAVRDRIGSSMILGLSIETEDQVAAVPAGVDYLGVGPIYATATKPDHAPPLGLDGFSRVVAGTTLPCLAIGGLTAADAAAIKTAGGAGMAVVSAISRAADMEAATETLLTAWTNA